MMMKSTAIKAMCKKENLAVDYHGGTKVKKWGE
jgi:hypothetical protein